MTAFGYAILIFFAVGIVSLVLRIILSGNKHDSIDSKRRIAALSARNALWLGDETQALTFAASHEVTPAESAMFDAARAQHADLLTTHAAFRGAVASKDDDSLPSIKLLRSYRGKLVACDGARKRLDLVKRYIPLSYDDATSKLKALLWDEYNALFEEAGSSSEMFYRLRKLIRYSRWFEKDLHLSYPEAWNTWLCEHILNPHLKEFHPRPQKPRVGDLRLHATQTLKGDYSDELDIVALKQIMALANAHPRSQKELGDSLVAQLAKAIVDHKTSKNFDRISLV